MEDAIDTQADARTDAPTPTMDALSKMTETVETATAAGEPCMVLLFRILGANRTPVAKIPGEQWDPFTIGERFGPGRYLARARIGSHWRGSAAFQADGPAVTPAPAAAPAAFAPAPAAPAASGSELSTGQVLQTLVAMMQAQAQASTQLVTALLQRPQEALTLKDVLPMVEKRSGVGELVEVMRAMRELAPEPGDRDEGSGLLAALAPALLAMQSQGTQSPQAARPAPPTARERKPQDKMNFAPVIHALRVAVNKNETPTQAAERLREAIASLPRTARILARRTPSSTILALLMEAAPEFRIGVLRSYAAQVLAMLRPAQAAAPAAAPLASVPMPAPVAEAKAPEPEDLEDDDGDELEDDDGDELEDDDGDELEDDDGDELEDDDGDELEDELEDEEGGK